MSEWVKRFSAILVAFLVAIFIYETIAPNQPQTSPTSTHTQGISEQRIDQIVERAMKEWQVPGMAVAVISPDRKAPLLKGYGIANVDTNSPVTQDTIFGIASHSKAYTVGALGILVDEAIINWQDRVQKWIPEFQLYDPWVSEHFTIEDLLSHRSGLPLGAGDLMWWPNPDFSRQDVINGLKYLKPSSEFRTKYDYDNLLYIVAGEIVTRASGMAWEDFVQKRLFDPLDMKTCYPVRNRIPSGTDEAYPHAIVNDKLVTTFFTKSEPSSSAASITCSIADHAKWVQMHLNDGKLANGDTLISEKAHKDMWTPRTLKRVSKLMHDKTNMRLTAYGLGWNVSNYFDQVIIQHSGGLQGMVTLTTLLPDSDVAVIVFTNRMLGSPMRAITYQILQDYFGNGDEDWITTLSNGDKASAARAAEAVSATQPTSAEPKAATLATDAYLGIYHDPWYGDIYLEKNADGKHRVRFGRTPVLIGDLSHHDGDTFAVKWDDRSLFADAYIMFNVKDGKVVGATMKAISPETDFSFDFHDLALSKRQ